MNAQEHANDESQRRTARAFDSIKRNGHHPAKPMPRMYLWRITRAQEQQQHAIPPMVRKDTP